MKVPFVDLYAQYQSIKEEIDQAIARTIQRSSYIGGAAVKEFEKAFADYIGLPHCIACGNGTDSLEILLTAYGIGPGDEVIIPNHSWISTAECVSHVGATPVFVDTHPRYFTILPEKIEEKITDKTRMIIPVHLYGMAADLDPIMALADKYNLIVIEDSAQAHGARYKGKKVGTIGHAASFSFYPGKNLGAYGDAGGMLTSDEDLAQKARMIANHGQMKKHDHRVLGRNSRLDGLQAAVLLAKLPHLDRWIELRQQHAATYTELLKDMEGIQLPEVAPYSSHVFHLYVVQLDQREKVMAQLKEREIATSIHYPHALSMVPAYQHLGYSEADTPQVCEYLPRIMSLPIYPEMERESLEYVADALKEVIK